MANYVQDAPACREVNGEHYQHLYEIYFICTKIHTVSPGFCIFRLFQQSFFSNTLCNTAKKILIK